MSKDGVTVTFELHLKPEAVAGFLEVIPHMIKETAAFEGFRSIRIVQNKDDPARVLFVELWDSEDAYRKYIAFRTQRGDMDNLAQLVSSTEMNVWPTMVIQI